MAVGLLKIGFIASGNGRYDSTMSGDSLARSIVQTPSYSDSPKGDSGYEAYHEAVLSSERGRSFLAEHERRQRQADREAVLAAIARVEVMLRDERSRRAERDVARNVERHVEREVEASTQTTAVPVPQADAAGIAQFQADVAGIVQPVAAARAELEAVTGTSGAALSAILTAAEQIQEIVWTLRDGGLDPRTCDSLDAKASEIYSACSVANLTGPRVEKAAHLLRDLEARIGTAHSAIAAVEDAPRADRSVAATPQGDAAERASDQHPEASQPSADTEAAQAQTRVAELLRPSLAGVRRRDATIADIARVMGNLIPAASKLSLVGMPAAAVEQRHSDAEATTATTDVAPQQPQADDAYANHAQTQHQNAPDTSTSADRAHDESSPSPLTVDDFNGFIEAWPQDRSEIDADEPQIEPPSESVTVADLSPPAESGALAGAKSSDPLSSALDSFLSRAMGLDKLVKRSVAAAFAQSGVIAEAPAAPASPPPPAPEAEAAPFISKSEQTQTLREAIAHLQAQRATDITPPPQDTPSASPLLLRDDRNDAAQDVPTESLLSQVEATDFDGNMEKLLSKAATEHAIMLEPADAAIATVRPKNEDAASAPISPTRAPAYASALGTADLDDFLFEESASAHSPAQEHAVSDAGQEPEAVASSGYAKAKSFAQLLDTSIPWAKSPEPRPVPVKVQTPASVNLDIDIAKESAASGAAYMPDPLARVRALSIDEKTALFG